LEVRTVLIWFFSSSQGDWNKGYGYYCFGCYADLHKDDPAMREHGFTVVKPVVPPTLKCTVRELTPAR
jgi:hypothetical protein